MFDDFKTTPLSVATLAEEIIPKVVWSHGLMNPEEEEEEKSGSEQP